MATSHLVYTMTCSDIIYYSSSLVFFESYTLYVYSFQTNIQTIFKNLADIPKIKVLNYFFVSRSNTQIENSIPLV